MVRRRTTTRRCWFSDPPTHPPTHSLTQSEDEAHNAKQQTATEKLLLAWLQAHDLKAAGTGSAAGGDLDAFNTAEYAEGVTKAGGGGGGGGKKAAAGKTAPNKTGKGAAQPSAAGSSSGANGGGKAIGGAAGSKGKAKAKGKGKRK
jgi:hypothetical protein